MAQYIMRATYVVRNHAGVKAEHDYLTNNDLPSKIYLHAYLQAQTGYSISSKIYADRRKATRVSPSRVYSWIKTMERDGYLATVKQNERKMIHAVDDKLITVIRLELKNRYAQIEEQDFKVLSKLIGSNLFRDLAMAAYQSARIKEPDAVHLVCNLISIVAAEALLLKRKDVVQDLTEAQKRQLLVDFEHSGRKIAEKQYHSYLQSSQMLGPDPFLESLISIAIVIIPALSASFLQKLSSLSAGGHVLVRTMEIVEREVKMQNRSKLG